jgi:hypothetical protein
LSIFHALLNNSQLSISFFSFCKSFIFSVFSFCFALFSFISSFNLTISSSICLILSLYFFSISHLAFCICSLFNFHHAKDKVLHSSNKFFIHSIHDLIFHDFISINAFLNACVSDILFIDGYLSRTLFQAVCIAICKSFSGLFHSLSICKKLVQIKLCISSYIVSFELLFIISINSSVHSIWYSFNVLLKFSRFFCGLDSLNTLSSSSFVSGFSIFIFDIISFTLIFGSAEIFFNIFKYVLESICLLLCNHFKIGYSKLFLESNRFSKFFRFSFSLSSNVFSEFSIIVGSSTFFVQSINTRGSSLRFSCCSFFCISFIFFNFSGLKLPKIA